MRDTNINRRGFLVGVLRWLGVAAVAAMAVVLGKRSLLDKQPGMARQDCTGQFICSRCNVNQTCDLPQAVSRRKAIEENTTSHR